MENGKIVYKSQVGTTWAKPDGTFWLEDNSGNISQRYEGEDRYGYKTLIISVNGKKKKNKSHRLIAKLFLDPKKECETVNHKNGIKLDNRVENLEWATSKENNDHMIYSLGKTGHWNKTYMINKITMEVSKEYESQNKAREENKYGANVGDSIRGLYTHSDFIFVSQKEFSSSSIRECVERRAKKTRKKF